MKNQKTSNPAATRRRYAFSAHLGAVSKSGRESAAQRLQVAFTIAPTPAAVRLSEPGEQMLSTHLFHSYAARTDPMTVRKLLQDLRPDQVVFDPFVGSGTTLVETSLRGAQGVGIDISEMSVRLSRFKSTPMTEAARVRLLKHARQVEERSLERVALRKKPGRTWDQAKYYEPHTYLELCGLREEIEKIRREDATSCEALLLVFSALLMKASKQKSESNMELTERKIGPGQVSRWFIRKVEETLRLQEFFAAQVPKGTPLPLVQQGDAREIYDREIDFPSAAADVILTSPPYLGVYNYAEHQLRRYAWLGLDPQAMLDGEMASRRESQGQLLPGLLKQHQADTNRWISGASRVLVPGGYIYIIVGDSFIEGTKIKGDEPIYIAAKQAGLHFIASCTVERLDRNLAGPQEKYSRIEHLIQFQKSNELKGI